MKFAYADPVYLGCASKYDHLGSWSFDTPEGHEQLIGSLCKDFPDGWAMSLSSPSLRVILPMCPEDCRVGAWTKPFASFKPGVNPAYCWEPVIWRGGRKRGRDKRTVRDFAAVSITLRRGFTGAKPEAFCWWVFDLLGLTADDELVDLFPGSDAVTRAWNEYQTRLRLCAPAVTPLLFPEEV